VAEEIKTIDKEPGAKLDYGAKFAKEFAKNGEGETITESLWVVPSSGPDADGYLVLSDAVSVTGLDGDAPAPTFNGTGTGISGSNTIVKLAGGTIGQTYQIQNRIKTSAGRRYVKRINIFMRPSGS
jgi:hypothetical protein